MKSLKAIYFLDRKSPVIVHPVSKSVTYYSLSRYDAERAVELAEQEAEERMQKKAIEAFKSSCLYQEGCLGAGMKCNPDKCEDLKAFIQKLKEDEVN